MSAEPRPESARTGQSTDSSADPGVDSESRSSDDGGSRALDHLVGAARDLIGAARSVLDAFEAMLDEPVDPTTRERTARRAGSGDADNRADASLHRVKRIDLD